VTQHYNKGIIWGKIISATEDKMHDKNFPNDPDRKVVCANLQIACPGDFGKANVFAKVMREQEAKQFLAEQNAGKTLRLEGFFAQYKDRGGVIKSNYNILSWGPCSPKDQTDLRAVFILVGRVDDIRYNEDGDPIIVLTTERSVKERIFKNTFALSTDKPNDFRAGEVFRVKGELRAIEDRFGNTIMVRPLILEAKMIVEDEAVPAAAPAEEGEIPF